MKLVDQGKLRLGAPLGGETYSLRQLLAHQAGLRDYGELPAYHAAVEHGDAPWTRSKMLAQVAELPRHAPGEAFAYSNVGYMLVGDLISAAMDAPLSAALEALIFDPLGLGARLAQPGDLATPDYDPRWVYHGLVVGPLTEAARFLALLLGGAVISDASLSEMRRENPLPQFSGPVFRRPAYGLGLMISLDPPIEGHSGGGPGSQIAVYRDSSHS